MPPDEPVLPGDDWEFPPVDPAEPVAPVSPPRPSFLPGSTPGAPPVSPPVSPLPPPVPVPEPVVEPTAPVAAEPVAEPVAAVPLAVEPIASAEAVAVEEPPSTGVLPVPRRSAVAAPPVSPVRALAGAAVAVAGVLLGIGALLWATDAPQGSPALQQTQAQSSDVSPTPSPVPSAAASPSPEPTTAPAPVQSAAPTAATAPKILLTVLNNSNVNKLAARAAAKYHAKGWPIKDTGSFRGRIPVTTVYYAPGQEASALLLQKEFPAIARVRPRFATLPGSGLTVVLTRDYPA